MHLFYTLHCSSFVSPLTVRLFVVSLFAQGSCVWSQISPRESGGCPAGVNRAAEQSHSFTASEGYDSLLKTLQNPQTNKRLDDLNKVPDVTKRVFTTANIRRLLFSALRRPGVPAVFTRPSVPRAPTRTPSSHSHRGAASHFPSSTGRRCCV